MNFSELVPALNPMSEAEETLFLERLWQLLARQTELYTMGESTSVPVETARELLASICYTLQFEAEWSGLSAGSLPKADLHEVLRDGQAHLVEAVKETKGLWARAYAAAQEQGDRETMPEMQREPQRGISCVVAYVKSRLQFDLT